MKPKIIKLSIVFALLFSLQGFSQSTDSSKHPLLDKYYPQLKDNDNNPAPAPQINTAPVVRTEPVAPPVAKPVVPQAKPVVVAPVAVPEPAVEAAPEPVTTRASSITTDAAPEVITTPAAGAVVTTPSITKPAPAATPKPVKPLVSQPTVPAYRDTRLGSSTKQYDTWEKNNNGAGSVTTSVK